MVESQPSHISSQWSIYSICSIQQGFQVSRLSVLDPNLAFQVPQYRVSRPRLVFQVKWITICRHAQYDSGTISHLGDHSKSSTTLVAVVAIILIHFKLIFSVFFAHFRIWNMKTILPWNMKTILNIFETKDLMGDGKLVNTLNCLWIWLGMKLNLKYENNFSWKVIIFTIYPLWQWAQWVLVPPDMKTISKETESSHFWRKFMTICSTFLTPGWMVSISWFSHIPYDSSCSWWAEIWKQFSRQTNHR